MYVFSYQINIKCSLLVKPSHQLCYTGQLRPLIYVMNNIMFFKCYALCRILDWKTCLHFEPHLNHWMCDLYWSNGSHHTHLYLHMEVSPVYL